MASPFHSLERRNSPLLRPLLVLVLVLLLLLAATTEGLPLKNTSQPSSLPSLWFIGASKCATSSVAAAFQMHPLIVSATDGESHLLDDKSRKHNFSELDALHKYSKLVARAAHGVGIGKNTVVAMEYTPEYLFEPKVPG